MEQTHRAKGSLMIFAASLLWSTGGALIKNIPWPAMALSSVRSGIGILVILLLYRQKKLVVNKWTLLSAFCLCFTMVGFVLANRLTTAANAVVLQYASPICVAVYMSLIYHQKPRRSEMLALFAASCGILLFFFDKLSGGGLLGNLIALATAFSFGGVFVVNSRPDCDGFSALILGQLAAFLIGLPFLLSGGVLWTPAPPLVWISALCLGVFQVGIPYVFFMRGIRFTPPLQSNIICMLEPVLNPVWVFLFLGELPGPCSIAGGLIVIATVTALNVYNTLVIQRERARHEV